MLREEGRTWAEIADRLDLPSAEAARKLAARSPSAAPLWTPPWMTDAGE